MSWIYSTLLIPGLKKNKKDKGGGYSCGCVLAEMVIGKGVAGETL